MAVDDYEIVCNGCRASVSSAAELCPHCGFRFFGAPDPVPTLPMSGAAYSQGGVSLTLPVASFPPGSAYDTADLDFAGFWIRAVAYVIDVSIMFAMLFLASLTIDLGVPPLALVLAVATLFYFPILESSRDQATFGKRACGLIVTDTSGRRISFLRALLRLLGRLIVAATFSLGYLLVAFTDRKRGLHDFIAGTLVVRR